MKFPSQCQLRASNLDRGPSDSISLVETQGLQIRASLPFGLVERHSHRHSPLSSRDMHLRPLDLVRLNESSSSSSFANSFLVPRDSGFRFLYGVLAPLKPSEASLVVV